MYVASDHFRDSDSSENIGILITKSTTYSRYKGKVYSLNFLFKRLMAVGMNEFLYILESDLSQLSYVALDPINI